MGLLNSLEQRLTVKKSKAKITNDRRRCLTFCIAKAINIQIWSIARPVCNSSNIVCVWTTTHYGRPLSVSGRPCYILPMFIYLFIFLWPPYSPALVNGGSRKFYTWWTLSVIKEVSSWIFSWSPLNYRVGQKVTKFSVFSDRTRKLSALTPESGRIL